MSSIKLKKTVKEQIKKDLMKHRFAKDSTDLMMRFSNLAWDVYCDVYTKDDRALMDRLPQGWLTPVNYLRVSFMGAQKNLEMSGRIFSDLEEVGERVAEVEFVSVPYKDANRVLKAYLPGHYLTLRFEDLSSRRFHLEEKFNATRHKVTAALDAASTLKQLIDGWPEVEPFARKHAKSCLKIPAVRKEVLNNALRLPAEELS